ncbi:uncharacterized protein LOC107363173 isoform X1 [Tetranychus urticae]|uniref:uncharacterized protein LOC107363173 isoform X1 n=1 Tax=Tetranychus urticae TaxID=32264 RepID=UPI00077BB00F|nr:uncharacterized protein LOC107363173 isoform X1 [Tetranychus urticae]
MNFARLICVIGCAIQLFGVLNNYFKREVISEVEFKFPRDIEVPDITFCTDFINAVNFDLYYNNQRSKIPGSCSHVNNSADLRSCLIEKFTIKEFTKYISQQYTVNAFYADLIIWPINIFEDIKFWIDSHESFKNPFKSGLCGITPYIREPLMCYTVHCKNSSSTGKISPLTVKQQDLRMSPTLRSILRIKFNETIFDRWDRTWIFLTPPGTLPRGFESAYLILRRAAGKTINYYISYKRVHVELLPYPFKSNCVYYNETFNGRTRLELFENCLNHLSNQRLGTIFYSTFNSVEVNSTLASPLRESSRYLHQYHKIEKQCSKLIDNPECISEYFITLGLGYQVLNKTSDQSTQLTLLAPTEPDLIKKSKPAFIIFQVFLYAGSVLGVWLGFNIVSHTGQIILLSGNRDEVKSNPNGHQDQKILFTKKTVRNRPKKYFKTIKIQAFD